MDPMSIEKAGGCPVLALPEGKENRGLVYGPLLTITDCMLLNTQMRPGFVVKVGVGLACIQE